MPRLDVRIHKPKKGAPTLSADRRSISVRVPLKLVDRRGRKLILTPEGSHAPSFPASHVDSTVKALARAFRWRKLLETGVHVTVDEIAKAERINPSYVSRVLRLTLLAPDIVTAILGEICPTRVETYHLFTAMPVEWERQRRLLASKRVTHDSLKESN